MVILPLVGNRSCFVHRINIDHGTSKVSLELRCMAGNSVVADERIALGLVFIRSFESSMNAKGSPV